jgi:hypothetical protein
VLPHAEIGSQILVEPTEIPNIPAHTPTTLYSLHIILDYIGVMSKAQNTRLCHCTQPMSESLDLGVFRRTGTPTLGRRLDVILEPDTRVAMTG